MACSIASIPLIFDNQNDDISDWIEANINPRDIIPWLVRSWPGFGSVGLAVPTGYQPVPRIRIGTFYWPVSASRWAYGFFLCSGNQLAKIAPVAFGSDGSEQNAVLLNMSSPGSKTDETLSTRVYLMPPIPLAVPGTTGSAVNMSGPTINYNNLYLLIVVDVRYYWWNIPCPDLLITPNGGQTWAQVITTLGGSTGINKTITASTIPTQYLAPAFALNLIGEPIPQIIDSVAVNIGMKFIRKYDGSCFMQNFSDAQASIAADEAANPLRTVRAGGSLFSDTL